MALFSSIAAGISGLLAGTFLASGVGAFILKAAVGIGLNLLASSLAGQPQETPFAIQGQLQTGGDVSRSFPVGYTATAGSLVYANTWGKTGKTPNAYFTQVIALSDLPVRELVGLWVNGERVTIDWENDTYEPGYPVLEYADGSDNALWIRFYDGTQTEADSFLVNSVSSEARPYESTRVGVGCAYAIVTAQIKEELFTGFPQFKFELNGCRFYDPSKDSSVGGAGAQRWADPSTWGGDGDHLPAVQLYNLLRGITFQGTWFYGLQGMSAARLPVSDWIAEIEKCRTTTKGIGGVDEPRYRCGGEIQVGAQISEAVKAILTSAQARLAEAGGTYTMQIGVSGAAAFGITDADILSTEEQTFSPFFGLADTINGINATYPSPAEGWNAKTAPPRYKAQFEAEDGNRRLLADVSLDFVPYKAQVQRLMKSALEEARRARRHTFVLPPKYWLLVPGDFVTWTSLRNGYEAKKFRVDGVIDKENLDVIVDMTEVDPSDYDWNQDIDFRTDPDGKLDRSRPTPQAIVDWFAEPAVIMDNNGNARRPAIRLTWDNSADQLLDVSGVKFAVRLKETREVVYRGRTDEPDAGEILISQNLLPNVSYQARGKLVPISDRRTNWSGWLDVVTPNIRLSDADVYLPGMVDDLREVVVDATEFMREGSRALIDEIMAISQLIAAQDVQNYTDKQEWSLQLASKTGDITAAYREEILAATGPTSGLVQRIASAEVSIADRARNSVVDALTLRTKATEDSIESISGELTKFTNELGKKATTTALNALTTKVTQQGSAITLQGSSITSIRNDLKGKASTESVSLLDGKIREVDGEVTAIANALIQVSAASGGKVAESNFRARATAGPDGYASRIGLEARTGGKGAWRSASLFLDVSANTSKPTRVVILADQFAVANVTGSGGKLVNPLIFQNGELRLNVANIGTVNSGQINSLNGKMKINLNAGTIKIYS